MIRTLSLLVQREIFTDEVRPVDVLQLIQGKVIIELHPHVRLDEHVYRSGMIRV